MSSKTSRVLKSTSIFLLSSLPYLLRRRVNRFLMPSQTQEWVDELRSGRWKQTRAFLERTSQDRTHSSHCCLGVACRLAVLQGKVFPDIELIAAPSESAIDQFGEDESFMGITRFDQNESVLPPSVRDYFHLGSSVGIAVSGVLTLNGKRMSYRSLVDANDRGYPFPDIANMIEENWHVLRA